MSAQPDPVFPGWEKVNGDRLHLATGAWVRKTVSTESKRPVWEVYSGALDGARYPSPGLAVYAVEHAAVKGGAS